jgi:hypothetical protein
MPILGIIASQISGHLWAPDGAYDSLATVTVGSGGAASVTFAGIPNTYKHLQLRAIYLCANAGSVRYTLNGDSGVNYSVHGLQGNGSSASAFAYPNETKLLFVTGEQSATYPAVAVTDFLDYSSTSKAKTIRALSGFDQNGAGSVGLVSGAWYNTTTAINSMTFTPQSGNFNQYSQFALYGVK